MDFGISDHRSQMKIMIPQKTQIRNKAIGGRPEKSKQKRANAAADVFDELNGDEKATLETLKAKTSLLMTVKHENDSLLFGEDEEEGRGPAKVEKSVKLLAKVFGSKSKASSILEGLEIRSRRER